MKKISVVVLNWNGKKLLEQFLPNVIQYSIEHADIVVADNGSTDDSVQYIKTTFPEVNIIENGANYGFAEGYNRAIKQLSTPYVLLLNSDVDIKAPYLEPLMEALENDPFLGAVQPKILDFKNPEYFEYAGASGGFMDYNFFPFCRGRIFNYYEKDEGQHNEAIEVFWASGAALFTRTSLFNELGGLDKDFFAHMEEIDLCWRIKNNGYRIGVIPESIVYHVGGATLSEFSAHKTFLNFRNNLYIIVKNYEGWLIPKLFVRLFLDGLAALKFLSERNFANVFAVLKGHFYFYLFLPRTLNKRRVLKNHG